MTKAPMDMTTGVVGKQLYKLTAPMVLGILSFMSVNLVDTFFVAQLGVAPLAAMSFTFPVIFCIASLAIGLGAGMSSVVARALGAKNEALASRYVADGTVLSLLVSVVVLVLGLLFWQPIFLLLGAQPETLPLIGDYMIPWFWSSALIILPMVVTAIMRASGNSGLAAKVMIITAAVNLILDPLLIFGYLGFPRLELEGAALASIIARLLSVLVAWKALWVLMSKGGSGKDWRSMLASWKAIMHVGLPAVATNLIIPVASGIVVYLVAKYGETAVAGLGVAVRIEPIALIVFYALSSIVGPFCGQNLGAHRIDRIYDAFKVICRFAAVFSLVMAGLLFVFAEPLVKQFNSDPEVVKVAVLYLTLVPISYGFYGVVMSLNAGFNGMGKPLPAVVLSFLRVLGFYLPIAVLLQWQIGVTGLFLASTVANVALGVLGVIYFFKMLRSMRVLPTN